MKNIIRTCLIILLFLLLTIAMFIYPTEVSYKKIMNTGLMLGVAVTVMDYVYFYGKRLSRGADLKFSKMFIITISRVSQHILMGDILFMFGYLNKDYSKPLVCICSLLLVGLVIDSIINIVFKIIKKGKEEVKYIRKAVKKD